MYQCDRECSHNLKVKNKRYCSIPFDNTVHNCKFEEVKDGEKDEGNNEVSIQEVQKVELECKED